VVGADFEDGSFAGSVLWCSCSAHAESLDGNVVALAVFLVTAPDRFGVMRSSQCRRRTRIRCLALAWSIQRTLTIEFLKFESHSGLVSAPALSVRPNSIPRKTKIARSPSVGELS